MVYLIIKLYPLFGLSLMVLSFDLMRTYRRRANSIWIFLGFLVVFFFLTVVAWVYFRGDLNSERWFAEYSDMMK